MLSPASPEYEEVNPEIKQLFTQQKKLHQLLLGSAKADLTFKELHDLLTRKLRTDGFVNLDFKGNFGHTIELDLKDRRYIVANEKLTLARAGFFTLEPHIKIPSGNFGIKHENIYYWREGYLYVI